MIYQKTNIEFKCSTLFSSLRFPLVSACPLWSAALSNPLPPKPPFGGLRGLREKGEPTKANYFPKGEKRIEKFSFSFNKIQLSKRLNKSKKENFLYQYLLSILLQKTIQKDKLLLHQSSSLYLEETATIDEVTSSRLRLRESLRLTFRGCQTKGEESNLLTLEPRLCSNFQKVTLWSSPSPPSGVKKEDVLSPSPSPLPPLPPLPAEGGQRGQGLRAAIESESHYPFFTPLPPFGWLRGDVTASLSQPLLTPKGYGKGLRFVLTKGIKNKRVFVIDKKVLEKSLDY
jgi:hypothetical protein